MERDFSVIELTNLKPRMRADLVVSRQCIAGEQVVIIEDQLRGKFFRLGIDEYRFMQTLDGRRTVNDAVSITAANNGSRAITQVEASSMLSFLIENELLEGESLPSQSVLNEKREQSNNSQWLRRINPLFIRTRLLNPDRFLERAIPALRPFLGISFFFIWLVLLMFALLTIWLNSERLAADLNQVFALTNWPWLLLAWVLLKCVHETFHAITCKYYGGRVYEAGVIWILFAPIGYVDASSSWMLSSKWQRMHVAAAGMYIEIFVASLFAMLWAYADYGPFRELALNVVLLASVTTLLFNANPLMKFDGYYLLSDYLEIPNLYEQGNRYARHVGKRHILGLDSEFSATDPTKERSIKVYGILSFCWRMLVLATLLTLASLLFDGAGVVVAAIAAFTLFGIPLIKTMRQLTELRMASIHQWLRPMVRCTGLLIGVWLLVWLAKPQQDLTASGVVDYHLVQQLFSQSDGVVQQIHVGAGEVVKQGQVLLHLDNPKLVANARYLELEFQRLKTQLNLHMAANRVADAKVTREQLATVKQRLLLAREKVRSLSIVADQQGVVSLANRGQLLGRRIKAEQSLGFVYQQQQLRIHAFFPQYLFDDLLEGSRATKSVFGGQESNSKSRAQTLVNYYIDGVRYQGYLKTISPSASRSIDYPALTTLAGGQLPALATEAGPALLVEPHVELVIEPQSDMGSLAGRVVTVEVRGAKRSLGGRFYRFLERWFDGVASHV